MRRIFFVCLVSNLLLGCASISEGIKGFLGISTKILEEKRDTAEKKVFLCSYEECFKIVESFLKEIKAYIYARKNRMLAFYVSEKDTTPVGIFIEPESEERTRLEVSSPSSFVKEEISEKLFAYLEKEIVLKEKAEK